MKAIRRFTVRTVLPESLNALEELAANLRWSWHQPTLELFRAPNEEHTALAPVRMGKGFRFTFAYTVDDQSNEGDLRAGG